MLLPICTFFAREASAAVTTVRTVTSTSCRAVRVNLAVGMTTQLVLEQEPKVTLYADKKHFKVVTNATSPRSLAVIPVIESADLDHLGDAGAGTLAPAAQARALDGSFKTNLFVFFDNSNQLMFDLRFVEKEKADYILKVKQAFNGGCEL